MQSRSHVVLAVPRSIRRGHQLRGFSCGGLHLLRALEERSQVLLQTLCLMDAGSGV